MALKLKLVPEKESLAWSTKDTIVGVISRTFGDALCKMMNIYYINFAHSLKISRPHFAFILAARPCGASSSLFATKWNQRYISSSQTITASCYCFLSGLLAISFAVIPVIFNIDQLEILLVMILCLIWYFYGLFDSFYKVSIIKLAGKFAKSQHKSHAISYLGISWIIATLTYLPIGYLIDYHWYLPFCVFGSLLLFSSFFIGGSYLRFIKIETRNRKLSNMKRLALTNASKSSFEYSLNASVSLDGTRGSSMGGNQEPSACAKLWSLMQCEVSRYVLIAHFLSAMAAGSIETCISGPWLQDVFHWSIPQTGFIGLIIFGSELLSTISTAFISRTFGKGGIFGCALFSFVCNILTPLVVGLLAFSVGSDMGGGWLGVFIALSVNFVYYGAWKIFWTAQQLTIMEYAPKEITKLVILQANVSITSFGKIIGFFITPNIWRHGSGLEYLCVFWFTSNCFAAICWILLYRHINKH